MVNDCKLVQYSMYSVWMHLYNYTTYDVM
jgi:hypothetical protein